MAKASNILLVANWESDVGYAWWLMENFWIAISEHFEQRSMHSYLIYPKITRLPDAIADSNIHVSERVFGAGSLADLGALRRYIRSNDIAYIYLSDSPAYSPLYLLLRLWGVRKIVVHDHTPGERTPARSLNRLIKSVIQRIPFFTADHFVAVTEYVYDRFINVTCIPAEKCSVAPNGITPIELDDIDPQYANHQFQIPEDRTIIITTGRASYYKGIDFFIRCADELINRQKHDRLHFLFCGDGPDMDDFTALVDQLKLNDHFTFAGKRSDIREILPSCDIGFHASKGEVGYSLSILEYMSAGLTTIVSDNPSTCEATLHRQNALLYRQQDIPSACAAIEQALDTEWQKRLTDRAISDVKQHYDIQHTNKKLLSSLDNVFR